MTTVKPLGALWRGLLAGVAGAGVQTLFFKYTAKIAPAPPKEVFTPPEEEQKSEMATHTVARRVVHDLLQRGPLTKEQKELGGQIVHYSFGGLWGGLYGLTAESFPAMKKPLGALAFGTLVWSVGDNLMLPAFKLSAWPQDYPLKTHAYAFAAHVVYGAGLWLTYASMTTGWLFAGAALYAARTNRKLARFLPKKVARRITPNIGTLVRGAAIRSAIQASI